MILNSIPKSVRTQLYLIRSLVCEIILNLTKIIQSYLIQSYSQITILLWNIKIFKQRSSDHPTTAKQHSNATCLPYHPCSPNPTLPPSIPASLTQSLLPSDGHWVSLWEKQSRMGKCRGQNTRSKTSDEPWRDGARLNHPTTLTTPCESSSLKWGKR